MEREGDREPFPPDTESPDYISEETTNIRTPMGTGVGFLYVGGFPLRAEGSGGEGIPG
jgi:hypothetical protein